MNRIAIVRICGEHGLTKEVKSTLQLLNLHKKNSCSVVKNNPSSVGMIKRIKDYVTWGELDEETFKSLVKKRGKLPGNIKLTDDYIQKELKISIEDFSKKFIAGEKELKDIPGIKPFFRLSPPLGGFERKGVKKPFSTGGVLGYRKEKINILIKKML
jgi:large subunit ribosomal protein L30